MKKILEVLLGIAFFILLIKPQVANAGFTVRQEPDQVYIDSGQVKFTFTSDQSGYFQSSNVYSLGLWIPGKDPNNSDASYFFSTGKDRNDVKILNNGDVFSVTFSIVGERAQPGIYNYKVYLGAGSTREIINRGFITSGNYQLLPRCYPNCPKFELDIDKFQAGTNATIYLNNIQPNTNYTLWYEGEPDEIWSKKFSQNEITTDVHGHPNTATTQFSVGSKLGQRTLCMTQASTILGSVRSFHCDSRSVIEITVGPPPTPSPASSAPIQSNDDLSIYSVKPTNPPPSGPCKEVTDPTTNKKTSVCDTAFGDINTNPAGFIKSIFTILLSFAGVIAVILIIASGYRLMASQGNPEKVQEAREQLTSAIVGLLFVIFSFSILQIIGVDILEIPGFER